MVLACALSLAVSSAQAAEKISYDQYAPVWKYPQAHQPEAAQKEASALIWKRALEQPFRPVGYGIGKTLDWVEHDHVDKKVIWFFDKLEQHGIYSGIRRANESNFGAVGFDGRIELDKLFRIESPYAGAEVFGGWAPNFDWVGSTTELGGAYKIEFPTEMPVFHEGTFRHRRSSSENFFGIGHHTSLGEWTTYAPDELQADGKIGYQFTDTVGATSSLMFQRMNIGNGNRERVGKTKERFDRLGISGLNGATLMGYGIELKRDTRDHQDDPKRGGRQAVEFSYFHDVTGDEIHYMKLAGSVSHFVPIGSDRRVFAIRLTGEKNKALGDQEIPFFNLARLGGNRRWEGSELLRSYRFNRFFDEGLLLANAEYRYSVWEYGNFAGDAVALADVGEVFGEIKRFAFGELRVSYGGGLNIKFRRKTILSVVLAHGSEGFKLTSQTKTSF